MTSSTSLSCSAVIVGGGISGLTAAIKLAESKICNFDSIIILEANNRLGGRIRRHIFKAKHPILKNITRDINIDCGAAYLHGINTKNNGYLISLLEKSNVNWNICQTSIENCGTYQIKENDKKILLKHYTPVRIYFSKKMRLNNKNFEYENDEKSIKNDRLDYLYNYKNLYTQDSSIKPILDVEKALVNLDEKCLDENNNILFDELPNDNISFNDYLISQGINDLDSLKYGNDVYCNEECMSSKLMGIRQWFICNTLWDYLEPNANLMGQMYNIITYHKSLIDNKYKNKIKYKLNSLVYKIDYNKKQNKCVTIYYKNTKNNKTYNIKCKYVICTVPTKQLQKGIIEFEPKLENIKLKSIKELYPTRAIKVFLQFNEKFWDDLTFCNIKLVDCFISEMEFKHFKKEENNNNENNFDVYSVMGIALGYELCSLYDKLNDSQIIEKYMECLNQIFSNNTMKNVKCIGYFKYDWKNHPFIESAWSGPKINSDGCRKELLKPINNCLFFAGEGYSQSFPAVQETIKTSFIAVNHIETIIKNNVM